MLPDGVPRPPLTGIFLASALAGVFLGYQAARIIAETAAGWEIFRNTPPGVIDTMSATAGSFLGLLVFLSGTAAAITLSIMGGYILEHRRTRKEEQREDTEWRKTGRRQRRRRARG